MTLFLAWVLSTWLIGAVAEAVRPGVVMVAVRALLERLS